VLEREHPAPGGTEQVHTVERELVAEGVQLVEEELERPVDVRLLLRAAAADLVVEDDRARVLGESFERREVVVRRAGTAVEREQRRSPRLELAGDAIPRAAARMLERSLARAHAAPRSTRGAIRA
jgi:hypothetical protein